MTAAVPAPRTVAEQAVRRAVQEHDGDALAALVEADWVHLVRVPGLVLELLTRLDHDHFERHPALELILDQVRPGHAEPALTPETITGVERLIDAGHFTDDRVRAGVEHLVLLSLLDQGRYEQARGRLGGSVRGEATDARKLGALTAAQRPGAPPRRPAHRGRRRPARGHPTARRPSR